MTLVRAIHDGLMWLALAGLTAAGYAAGYLAALTEISA